MVKLVNSNIYNSVVPDYRARYHDPIFDETKEEVNQLLAEYLKQLEAVKLRDGLTTALHVSSAGNSLLQKNKFNNRLAESDPERLAAITGIAINLIYLCASLFEPYLPATASKILTQLQAPILFIPDRWTADDIKPGHTIGKAEYLFSTIPEKKVGYQ